MNRNHSFILTSLAGILVFAILFGTIGFEAIAQDGATPMPGDDDSANRRDPEVYYGDPAISEGDAEWTITDRTFTSSYPDGFQFTATITSSAGDIQDATAVWSHAPRQLRRRSAEYDEGTETFIVTWEAEESTPPWVAVNYQWRITDVEGNSYISEWFRGDEYYDLTAEWERLESDDIIIFVQAGLPSDTGQQVIDAMAAQRETFRQAWGDLLSNKPRAILFANRESFRQWRTGASNPAVIGQTSSDWGGTVQVMASGGVVDLAWGTVLHEVGHLYQEEFAPAGFPAGSWWLEGNATFFELHQQYDYEQRVRNIAARGQLPALLQGTGPNPSGTGPDGIGRFGYDVGYTFWKWIVVNYGLDAHRAIVEGIATGISRDVVLEEVLGMSTQDIERSWRVWLGTFPDPPTLIPTPEFRFPPTVTPFQFPTSSSE